jgi:alkyldihydroxyacetonephosphate synthase
MIAIDRASLLVSAPGSATLREVEERLATEGLTLRVASETLDATVADWLGRGAPGAPSQFADPADHLLAGLEATLLDGRTVLVRPSPRRAVGPDLAALFLGAAGRFGTIVRADLRAHVRDARVAAIPVPDIELDAPVSEGEEALLVAIGAELKRAAG